MENNLLFDFIVSKENNTIEIKREFDASLDLVWDAWTKPEILDQWWMPKPYRAETKLLNFKENDFWLYAVHSPETIVHWCKADYKKIESEKLISWLDAFCDENGIENDGKPRSLWTNIFSENNGITVVNITLQHNCLADIEQMISMGFQHGLTKAMEQLDEYLLLKK